MDWSRRVLSSFVDAVRSVADVEGFGIVCPAHAGFADCISRVRTMSAVHRLPLVHVPDDLRSPPPVARTLRMDELGGADQALVDFLHAYGVSTLALAAAGSDAVFWAGLRDGSFTGEQLRGVDMVASRVAAAYALPEPREERTRRLARLERVNTMLSLLSGVLDVRDAFPRLAAIAREAIEHDLATVQLLDTDRQHARLIALDGIGSKRVPETFEVRYPAVLIDTFLFAIHHDVAGNERERPRPATKAGMRSVLRVPLVYGGSVGGALEFSTDRANAYDEGDAIVARRIAEYVALAIAHQRMAEEAARAARAQERDASLRTLDQLLPALSGVLDVRSVFDRVSEIARRVIPHDAVGLPLLTDDREHVMPFATAGVRAGAFAPVQPLPEHARYLFSKPWDYEIFDDAREAPSIGATTYSDLGFMSVLRVPVRLRGRTEGALVFFAKEFAAYSRADVVVAKRIADHVALALSHQRLAENARKNEALRARAARLELLDELLASVTGAGDLRTVFDRVSAVAQKVLEHDALVLTAVNPDGVSAKVYAHHTRDSGRFPDEVEVPPYMIANPDWEHELLDDLQALENQKGLTAARLGYRAALRVSIRLDGRYVAGVSFLSMTPGFYKPADVIVARRIADHLALNFAREHRTAAARRADEATARASELESKVRQLTEELDATTGYRRVLGESGAFRSVLKQAAQVAATDTTVLLLGESGSGKEVVARFIHRASPRQYAPFLALNCAALPEQLLEAELFGYERGAFTGATQSKPGQLEQASGGTLFLDEVGEMSPTAQAKFLRVLQEREFQRLGGTRVLRTDARIIAATNRDLSRMIDMGAFREDLFYRLNVFAIQLPSLRDRMDDVLPLAEAFLVEYGKTLGRPPSGISRDARRMLLDYDWPGNVRELRNILERAAILCDGGLITAEHLDLRVREVRDVQGGREARAVDARDGGGAPEAIDLPSVEKAMVLRALEKHRFNKAKAARELGLTRAQLYVRMKRHGLE